MNDTIANTETKTLTAVEENTLNSIRDRIKDRTKKYYIDTGRDPVSYTHLDVYKRQVSTCSETSNPFDDTIASQSVAAASSSVDFSTRNP